MIVRLLTMTLERDGWEVISAMTGAEALAALDRQPELVLLDGMLPDTSGAAVLAEVRRTVPAARVVVVSGLSEDEVAGADAYIRKPFTGPVVRETVASVLAPEGT
jgi:DNA-binding response OmpR family regulator